MASNLEALGIGLGLGIVALTLLWLFIRGASALFRWLDGR